MRNLLAVLFLSLIFLIGCAPTIETGDLKTAYQNQVELNPAGLCTPTIMEEVWRSVEKNSLSGPSACHLLKSGVGGILGDPSFSSRVRVRDPSRCTPTYLWLAIDQFAHSTPYSHSALCFRAVDGILAGLDDPWARFTRPRDAKRRIGYMLGHTYSGIGVRLRMDPKTRETVIKEVVPSGPADRAGIKQYDQVISVNGIQVVSAKNEYQVAGLMLGKAGTSVTVTIKRTLCKKPGLRTYVIIRKSTGFPSASCKMWKGLPYCQIRSFNASTMDQLEEAINNLPPHKGKKIIVDMRSNPGGLLFVGTHMTAKV